MSNQLMTHPMILLAGNSLVEENQKHAKNLLLSVLDGMMNFLSDPSKGSRDTVVSYMKFTDGDAAILTTILEALQPIAFGLIVVFMLVNLMNQYAAMGNQMSIIIFTKVCLFTVVAVVALDYIGMIVSQFCTLQNGFADTITESVSGVSLVTKNVGASNATGADLPPADKMEAVIDAFKNLNMSNVGTILQSGELVLLGFFGNVIDKISMLITSIVVFAAKLEIMVRFAFTPIALAGLCSDDHRTQAMHYLRKCLAASLYCGGIMILMYIATAIPINNAVNAMYEALVSGAEGGNAGETALEGVGAVAVLVNSIAMTVIGPFSAIGAISTVKSTINEALGA